jgi:hypothetical protein
VNIAYVDDAGDVQTVPHGNSGIQPVLAFAAVVLKAESLSALTLDFLALKRALFRGKMKSRHLLDDVLIEVKGADLRQMIRDPSRRRRRRAIQYMHELLSLLEAYDAKLIARVWVKGLARPIDGRAINGYTVQSICATYQDLLVGRRTEGLLIIDSSTPGLNQAVSHSIFTRRYRAGGDDFDRLVELPVFGHSTNHAGLQIADVLASGLITPIATRTYCVPHIQGTHVHPNYDEIKSRFAHRLKRLQHRHQDAGGAWKGGITVSDQLGHLPSARFFA